MKSGYALFTTLHLSSPCIFWGSEIIPCSLLQPSLKTSAGHQWWPSLVISKRLSVYPLASGEEWWRVVKSEQALFTSHNPSVYRGFRGICEEWRVKSRVGFFSRKPTPPATRKLLPNRSNSPIEIYLPTYYFMPGNGTILPQLRATLCHYQAKSGISLLSNLNKAHSLMLHTLLAE